MTQKEQEEKGEERGRRRRRRERREGGGGEGRSVMRRGKGERKEEDGLVLVVGVSVVSCPHCS